jgi:hypothetical protein
VKGVSYEVNGVELGVSDFDAFLVGVRVDGAFDLQSGRGRRRADQFDDREAVGEGTSAPGTGESVVSGHEKCFT